MDLQLKEKIALVIGASKGIGRAVAEQLADEGVDVAITARTEQPLEDAAREIAATTQREILPLAGDMGKSDDVDRCVKATLNKFGRIDILVTCAGSSPGGSWQKVGGGDTSASYRMTTVIPAAGPTITDFPPIGPDGFVVAGPLSPIPADQVVVPAGTDGGALPGAWVGAFSCRHNSWAQTFELPYVLITETAQLLRRQISPAHLELDGGEARLALR